MGDKIIEEKLLGTGAAVSEPNEWQLCFVMGKSLKGALKSRGWKAKTPIAVYENGDEIVIRKL